MDGRVGKLRNKKKSFKLGFPRFKFVSEDYLVKLDNFAAISEKEIKDNHFISF